MRSLLTLLFATTILLSGCQKLNTFEVNKDFCYRHMMPLMQFSLKYPADLQTDPPVAGARNLTYNYFFKTDEAGMETESIGISYLSLGNDTTDQDADMEVMIGQMEADYEEAGFELEDRFTGTEEFDGKSWKMFRATGTIDKEEYDLKGRYRILAIIIPPQYNNNGLLVSMMARDDSPIQSYDDFADEGSISTVWSTLEIEQPE